MRVNTLALLAAGLCAALAAPALRATTVLELGFDALVAESAVIVRGEVVEQRAVFDGQLPHTVITVAVADTLKGSAPAVLSLSFMGGEHDNVELSVAGQFVPPPGSRGVFFIDDLSTPLVNPLTGWHQGFFPLFTDALGDFYLDLRQRPDFHIPGLPSEPLVTKMQDLGFSAEAIERKAPALGLFAWPDFRAAIVAEVARQAGGR